MEEVRLCTVRIIEIVEALPRDNLRSPLKFAGFVSKANQFASDAIYSAVEGRLNVTLMETDKIGVELPNGTITGCLGKVFSGEADLAYALHEYPISDRLFEKIFPLPILFEDRVQILSAFNRTEEVVDADIFISSLSSFSLIVWWNLFVLIMWFIFLMSMKIVIEKRFHSASTKTYRPVYEVLTSMSMKGSFDYDDWFRRYLAFVMSLAAFFFINYYLNLMSSDLSIPKQPTVIRTFDDLLARPKLTPLFIRQWTDMEEFRTADSTTIKGKLWKSMQGKNYEIDISTTNSLVELIFGAIEGKTALVMSRSILPLVISTLCRFKGALPPTSYKDTFPYTVEDDSSNVKFRVMVMSQRMAKTSVGRRYRKSHVRLVEHGLVGPILKDAHEKGFLPQPTTNYDRYCECMENSLHIRGVDLQPVRSIHLRGIMYSCTCGICVAVTILLVEIIVSRKRTRINVV